MVLCFTTNFIIGNIKSFYLSKGIVVFFSVFIINFECKFIFSHNVN